MILPINIWPAHMMNCFLIKGDKGHVLVDAGVPGSGTKILSVLARNGVNPSEIKLIVVTHAHLDHFGGVGELKEELGIPVLGHQLDTEYYQKGRANVQTMKPTVGWAKLFRKMVENLAARSFTPDIIMSESSFDLGEWLEGVTVIHTPGHTPGSVSVLLPNREAIIMDMMSSGVGLGGVFLHRRVKHPAFHDDLKSLKRSFEQVLSLDIQKFYLGHGKAVNRSQVEQYVNRFLKHY